MRGSRPATGRVDPPIRNKLLASSQEVVFALSTDGSRLAASEIFNLGYDPGPVRLSLIELLGQQFQRTLESVGGAPLQTIAVSRDGRRVAAGG